MKKKIKESLVTDQPARKVIFSGIIISFLLGYFIKGLTKPELLQSELKAAVSKIHSTTEVNWGRAEVSLKNGWWPRFSIMIYDVKIVSEESCWGSPLLYARELELPISFVSFFERGQPLDKIFVRDAFLELKSNFVCKPKVESAAPVVKAEEKPQAIKLKPAKTTREVPPLVLTDFVFENLKLRQSEWVFPDWNFTLLELNVRENHPWFAEINSDFSIPDMEGVDTGAHLSATYKEFPAQVLEIKVNGHWREGTFWVNGLWEGNQKGWTYQSKFNHIPFQFLKSVANRTRTPWNWPDKPMWFSFSTQTVVPFTDWKSSQHFVRQMDIEGDLGELSIPDLEIKSWAPFKVNPFAFSVQQADLSAVFDQDIKKQNFLGSFGKLSGQGQWSSEKDVLFTGKVEQVQIPLFHREQKFVEVIKSFDLQAELKSGQWKMSSQKWELDRGQIAGNLKLDANQDLTTGQIQVSVDRLQLDPETLRFMEIVTPDFQLDGKLSARWKKSIVQDFQAQVKSDLLESRVIEMDKPNLTVKKTPNFWDLKLQSGVFKIRELSFAAFDVSTAPDLKFPYESKTMLASLQMDSEQNVKWNLSSSNIRSNGTIDHSGGLKGSLFLGPKNSERAFEMTGSRRNPALSLLK